MNGSGCKTCPVKPCHTLYYRGSYCAEQRAKFGLGDPQTNADRIRAMSDEELAEHLIQLTDLNCRIGFCQNLPKCDALLDTEDGVPLYMCEKCLLDWLQQPAEVSDGKSNDQK